MRPATADEIKRWDQLVAANPDGGEVLQLRAFGQTKAGHGWRDNYLMLGDIAVLALSRHIPGLGELWYVPNGPAGGSAAIKKLISNLPDPKPFMVKFDPLISAAKLTAAQQKKLGLVRAPRNIQYNISTVIVDLAPGEDDILASFKQKTRYNIRLAAKKGVTVQPVDVTDESINTMYHLTQVTTSRAGVYLRDKSYFADFWRLHAKGGHGQMFFASYEGQVLAGAFVTYVANKALYKDGGSVREHTSVQAPYALQWEAMRWLKSRGVTKYDLHGVPPQDRIDDPTHPLAGLARFKTGFQQEVTEFAGTFDYPVNLGKYDWWRRGGERLSAAYEYRVKRRLFY